MIYLENDSLEIRFPDLHENAGVKIDFQRTLRLTDNGDIHHLPPGLGNFPLRHIEDFDLGSSNHLKKRGGVIMPMFQEMLYGSILIHKRYRRRRLSNCSQDWYRQGLRSVR